MISFLSVLVSRGYCHKAPQTRWLKPQRCIVSQSRSPRTRCPQDWFLPRGLPGRIRSLLLPKLLAIFGILRLIGAALQSPPSPSLGILPVYMSLVQISPFLLGFPGGASAKEPTGQCRRHKRRGFNPWVRKIPWRRKWQPSPVFLLGESLGQRSLVGCVVHRVTKSWTRLKGLSIRKPVLLD